MIEAQDIQRYTEAKMRLQIELEEAYKKRLEAFDLDAFLEDPRGYTRAFLESAVAQAVLDVAPRARAIGTQFAKEMT